MNSNLKTAELVREHIDKYLPGEGPIAKDRLNYVLSYLTSVGQDINPDLPLSMTTAVALYSMANFTSQFQFKINLNGVKVPPNVISFLLVHSGVGKDSTITAQRNAMDTGYAMIEEKRKEMAEEKARKKAEELGEEAWGKYYKEPMPLENSISTAEGLTYRLNAFAKDGIGMPSIVVSELGSELQSNPNMTENIRLISELFDLGNKKSKAIKDSERQDEPVHGMGMCGMFVGSEDNIILDKSIAKKFQIEFVTKLARRSFFTYPTKEELQTAAIQYESYEELKRKQQDFRRIAQEAKAFISSQSMAVANEFLGAEAKLLELDEDAMNVYEDYKVYTSSLAKGMDFVHKSVELELMHRSWKMLKLAGVFAMWDCRKNITVDDIEDAIYVTEKLGKYLEIYEDYASKEPYELLVDYLRSNPGKTLTIHEVKKREFITGGTSNLENKIKELVKLADSYAGADGMVVYEGDVIAYKPFEKVGEHGASFLKVSGTKEERAVRCHSGYTWKTTTFPKLKNLLDNDTAYSPFKFLDGKRSNDNIISGATWAAIDVDDADVDIYEMHDILGDYNHHIATTSNRDNPYKYRILLEFNKVVDLPPREWKSFMLAVTKQLGLHSDPSAFTKSQIQFGYAGSLVLSEIQAEPFDVTDALRESNKVALSSKKEKIPPSKARKMLDDPLTTFSYAFNDEIQSRSLTMYKMFMHALDLGAKPEEVAQLMDDLNEFWINPIEEKRLEKYKKQMFDIYERKYSKS